jgi:hypothetical protein
LRRAGGGRALALAAGLKEVSMQTLGIVFAVTADLVAGTLVARSRR